ncbi:MAG: energy-coupling factor transporter transmembrane component T [Bacillota bacterium]
MVQYYPGKTFIHCLDPRVKVVSLFILTIVIFLITNFIVISLIFLGTLIFWLKARLPISILYFYMKILAVLLVILIAMQALFYPGSTIIFSPIIPEVIPLLGGLGKISKEGLIFGLIISFRLVTLICLMPLITFTTSIEKMALGLIKMGLPYTVAYTATTALNMIPILQTELGIIIDAQRLRAFQTFEKGTFSQKVKAYPTLVIPLIMGSMRRAQSMGVAMDSKAFGASKTRTFLEDITMQKKDWAFMILVVLFCITGVYVNFSGFLGIFN